MNELTYSFIGSLRAWLRENEDVLEASKIKVDILPYTLHYGISASFHHEHFAASFFIWEKLSWDKAMSDIDFVDWPLADQDPEYQVEWTHYEYGAIDEMRTVLDSLRDRLLSVHQKYR